ncbi:DUF2911 domain-containing protein [Spirosoma aureum]|uniref:DUF2911 domain-containing protein n=1 Tax=Spirosoma aureum TaxID=2692134 RepID=A0A6G9AM92_9BACT|nr:DUF2911 domain-containing protein [Spirosoma aureum]QIP13454.1 DUF2911 domain-containing protein [Spirosoma aureum]
MKDLVKCVGALFLTLIFAGHSWGQVKPYTASFIGTMGPDTVFVETYNIINNHLYGKVLFRMFENHVGVFNVHFYPDGTIREFNMMAMDPINSSLPYEAKVAWRFPYNRTMICADDTCTILVSRRDSPQEVVVKQATSSMDFYGGTNPLFSLIEWNCMRLAKSGKQVLGPLTMTNTSAVSTISVRYTGENAMVFGGPFIEYTKIKVDATGRIINTDGTGTAYNFLVTKHAPIDIDQLAKRMVRTIGIGDPSPRDTVAASIQKSTISIDYSRPSRRGRKIFGGVVPYDSVWRTGASNATVLSLQHPIQIGKTVLPAGKYSLYTIPGPQSWQLIFNTNTTKWPTDPDRSKDFAQVALLVKSLDTPKDQFTIEIQETKTGGTLKFQWDDKEAYTDFKIIRN